MMTERYRFGSVDQSMCQRQSSSSRQWRQFHIMTDDPTEVNDSIIRNLVSAFCWFHGIPRQTQKKKIDGDDDDEKKIKQLDADDDDDDEEKKVTTTQTYALRV